METDETRLVALSKRVGRASGSFLVHELDIGYGRGYNVLKRVVAKGMIVCADVHLNHYLLTPTGREAVDSMGDHQHSRT